MNEKISKLSQLDRLDLKIIDILSKEGRLSVSEIARRVGASKTPCQVRLTRLIERGYIKGFRAILDSKKMGLEHVAFAEVKLSDTREAALKEFNQAILAIPEIEQCHLIAGQFDYLLKIRSSNIVGYRNVLADKISKLPHLASTSTFISMESIKDSSF